MKNIKKVLLSIFVFLTLSASLVVPGLSPAVQTVGAQDNLLCDIFPFLDGITLAGDICDSSANDASSTAATSLGQWLRFGVSLIFIGIIAVAIIYIIRAAIKYIRSEGNEEEVQEATKAIKAVFIGIGALLVGIVGLVIVLSLFNAAGGEQFETEDRPEIIEDVLGN